MKYLVGVDEGTTGCRVCLFDENGNIISSHACEYSSYFSRPGYVEQDISEIKESVFSSIRETIEHSGVNLYDIAGISHSNQGITMVLLDEYDNPAREKTIGWQDVRHTEILPELRKIISDEEYYQIAGMGLGTYNIPIINWLRKYEPNTWQHVKRLCSHQDYFLHEYGASGYYIDEGSANFMSMVDVHNNEYNKRLLDLYEVHQNQLPIVIHEPGNVVGFVTDDISSLTSLPSGCSISLGGLDTNCSSFAAGADKAGKMVLIVGTAGVSILITDHFCTDPDRRITIRSNPGFGNYQQYIMTNTAASSFRWFRDELCSMEVATSRLIGCDPYDLMTSMACLSEPGAKGVTALTCLQGSHGRLKNENARGTFLGISFASAKADLAEAILEGITFEMYDLMLMHEKLSPIETIRLCGGVAKSSFWCQMFADILQKPIEITRVPELGSLGAAMCAGIGAGIYKDQNDAISKCVHIVKRYLPNNEKHNKYEAAFRRWKEAYDLLGNQYYKQ